MEQKAFQRGSPGAGRSGFAASLEVQWTPLLWCLENTSRILECLTTKDVYLSKDQATRSKQRLQSSEAGLCGGTEPAEAPYSKHSIYLQGPICLKATVPYVESGINKKKTKVQKTVDSIHWKSCTCPSRDRALKHFTALKFPKSTLASIIFKMEEITGTPPRSGHLTETR